jgi:ATP-dependent Clp protease protease subunit
MTQPASKPAAEAATEVYGVFCGMINQQGLAAIIERLTKATAAQEHVTHVHLLFQSVGGSVGDCVCLYNVLRGYSLGLTLYNAGSIQSGAVTAYLGAQHRKASRHSLFMLHRAHTTLNAAASPTLESAVTSVRMDDVRTEAIIREHTRLPDALWERFRSADLFLTAAEAVSYGFADEIGDFAPPPGTRVFFI